MGRALEDYQLMLAELEWQNRVRLRAAEEDRPIPKLPAPTESTVTVRVLSHKEERELFDPEQERIYFFCAYYTPPTLTYEGGWLGYLDNGNPDFVQDAKIKPEPHFLHSLVRELAFRFPYRGHKSVARTSQNRFCYFHILESAETEIGIPSSPQIPEEVIIKIIEKWHRA